MTTMRDIVTRAYRRGALRDASQSISASDASMGLQEAQDLMLSLPGTTWWNPVEVTADYTAGENERVRSIGEDGVVVTIPNGMSSAHTILMCCDRFSVVCCGAPARAPKDGARVQVTDVNGSVCVTYYYRADAAEWVRASDMTLAGDVPLNSDMHSGFTALLALRLLSMEPLAQPSAMLTADAANALSRMRGRYGKRQDVAVDLTLLRTSAALGGRYR